MTDAETQLLNLLKQRSFREGSFRLASGVMSTYYIDGRMSAVYSAGAALIGQVLFERTKNLNVNAIGGLAVGAVPLTTAAVIAYHLNQRQLEGFWVRDEVKDHGTRKQIEGGLREGMRVVVVDDVITKGGSALKAVQAVQKAKAEVVQVLALVDRLQGAEQLFRDNGINCYSAVFTIRDFGVQ
ncbi:MAG TPA: orotate phosphoribosyltransferase [Gemmataceae bacterium]|jgi:orotate phosphoribosyltransferase|nr:orotate phosphoribosyltransferase [Gemmataceae bacterium]